MDRFLNKYYFLKSRKFWAFVFGWVAILITCLQTNPFPVDNFINASVALVLGYIGSVAFEDGMEKRNQK